MPTPSAPTNTSPGTAIDLLLTADGIEREVPWTTVRIDTPLWYAFVPPAGTDTVNLYAHGDFATVQVRSDLYTGSPSSLVPYPIGFNPSLGFGFYDKPRQVSVTPGTKYFVKLSYDADTTSDYTAINLNVFNQQPAPVGTVFINDFEGSTNMPVVLFSPTTGEALQIRKNFPAGDEGVMTPSGTFILEDLPSLAEEASWAIFNSQFQKVATFKTPEAPLRRGSVTTNGSDKFYIAYGRGSDASIHNIAVYAYNLDGTQVGPGWDPFFVYNGSGIIVDKTLEGVAISPDSSILYFGEELQVGAPIRRVQIGNPTLGDLPTEIAPLAYPPAGYQFVMDIIVLGDGTIVAGAAVPLDYSAPQIIQRWAPDGTLLNTYTFPIGDREGRLATAPDDPTSFWSWIREGNGINKIRNIRVSDGVVLQELTTVDFVGGMMDAISGDPPPATNGHSNSCPLLVTRNELAPPPVIPVNNTEPCCAPSCSCPTTPGTSGNPPNTPGVTGELPELIPPLDMLRDCEGGGEVAEAEEIVDSESWAA